MDHILKEHLFDLMLMVAEGERGRAYETVEKIVDTLGLEGLHQISVRMAHVFSTCVLGIEEPSGDTEVEMTPIEPASPELTWATDVIAAYASHDRTKLHTLIFSGIDMQDTDGRVERLGHLIRLAIVGYRSRDDDSGHHRAPTHTLN